MMLAPSMKKDMKKAAIKKQVISFKNRKDCIKRKAEQLATLCGTKACFICIWPGGACESWPENRSEVEDIIRLYQNKSANIKKESKESLKQLLMEVELRLKVVNDRIELLKTTANGQNSPGMGRKIGATIQEGSNGIYIGTSSDQPSFGMGSEFGTTTEEGSSWLNLGTSFYQNQPSLELLNMMDGRNCWGTGTDFGTTEMIQELLGIESSYGMGSDFGTVQEGSNGYNQQVNSSFYPQPYFDDLPLIQDDTDISFTEALEAIMTLDQTQNQNQWQSQTVNMDWSFPY